jgi:hypothetical protein
MTVKEEKVAACKSALDAAFRRKESAAAELTLVRAEVNACRNTRAEAAAASRLRQAREESSRAASAFDVAQARYQAALKL